MAWLVSWGEEDEEGEGAPDFAEAKASSFVDFQEVSSEAARKSENLVELVINFYREILKRVVIKMKPSEIRIVNRDNYKEIKAYLGIYHRYDDLPLREGITRKEKVEKLEQEIVPFDLSVKAEELFKRLIWIVMSGKEQERILSEARNYISFYKSVKQGIDFIGQIWGVKDNSPNEEWNKKVKELKEKSVIKEIDISSDYNGFELKIKTEAFNRFIDVRGKTDEEIKEFCRNLEKEVEEYLKGGD
jgi:hypothetical protein